MNQAICENIIKPITFHFVFGEKKRRNRVGVYRILRRQRKIFEYGTRRRESIIKIRFVHSMSQ